jgi:hypothetical protein
MNNEFNSKDLQEGKMKELLEKELQGPSLKYLE